MDSIGIERRTNLRMSVVDLGARFHSAALAGWFADLHWLPITTEGTEGTWTGDDRIECVGITVRSTGIYTPLVGEAPDDYGRPRPISTRLLRQIRWGEVIGPEKVAILRSQADAWKTPLDGISRERRAAAKQQFERQIPRSNRKAGPGRPPLRDLKDHRDVAKVYGTALTTGSTSTPVLAVARHFNIERTTATKWVWRARQVLGDEFPKPPRPIRTPNDRRDKQ